MSVGDRIKQSAEGFCKRLQLDLAAQLEEFVVELARAAEEEHAAAVAEATARLAGEVAAVKADAERSVHQQIERVREEALQGAREAVAAEVEGLRRDLERLRGELAHAVEAADAARRAREQAEESFELERARAALESQQAVESSVMAAVSDERQAQLQAVERVLAAIRRLDRAQSLTEVLTALADSAAAEAPRVAILVVQGERLRGWRLLGFGPAPPAVDLDRRRAGVLAQAIEQGEVAFAEPAGPGQPTPAGPGFTTLPPDRVGLAVPIHVGGQAVAVLYADDVSEVVQGRPAAWPEMLEILTRHAALRLENLTAVRTAQAVGARPGGSSTGPAAGAASVAPASGAAATGDDEAGSARRYARLLVSEIKLYNEAAVRLGREHKDLLARLGEEIDRARRLYEERVPAHVRAARAFFDEELVRTLADGDPALLGRPADQSV